MRQRAFIEHARGRFGEHERCDATRYKEKFPCYVSMRCPFGFATLQRSRLRFGQKTDMRVNKPYFLKENTLFRNGKSKEELLRN